MGTLTIRNLDDAVHASLRKRAAEHGRSMEAEARAALAEKYAEKPLTGAAFYDAMRACMVESGGFEEGELVLPDRSPPSEPITFDG